MSARVSAVIVAVSLSLGVGVATLLPQTALAQQKDRTVNPKMGPPLKAALTAAQAKQYDVALAKLKEAEAEKKTAYEQFKIYETQAFIYNGQKKYAETAAAYEKMMESQQFLTPEQQQTYPKTIALLYATAGQHNKVLEYGKRWLQDKPNDVEMMALVGQSYYSTQDFKACQTTFSNAVSIAEKNGSKPQEPWLRFVQTCASKVGDNNTEGLMYEKLIRYYPKAEYWQPYLSKVSRNDRGELASFNWLRLMSETNSLKSADDYMNYAQRGMTTYGLACEAAKVLEEGFSKKVLGSDEKAKERQTNTLKKAKEVAAADKAKVSQLLSEAESDATGQKYVDAGMIQLGCEQYDQAISSLDKGIKKGGGKDPTNAKLSLGIAQLHKGDREGARNTFKSLANDKELGKVASSWTLRSYN